MTNFSEFGTWLADQDRSEKTINGYLADIRRFSIWFEKGSGKELNPLSLTPTDIKLYRNWLQENKAKPTTTNRQLAAIRAYAKWAQESDQINNNPMRGIRSIQMQKLAPKWLERS